MVLPVPAAESVKELKARKAERAVEAYYCHESTIETRYLSTLGTWCPE